MHLSYTDIADFLKSSPIIWPSGFRGKAVLEIDQ
jgi:hypothetical protein